MQDNSQHSQQAPKFIGIDWADREHEVCVIDADGRERSETLEQSPEAIGQWLTRELADGPIAIMLEQSRGALAYALMLRDKVVLYPVNPKQFSRYRESYSNAGSKNDRSDARLLARMLRERIDTLTPWTPDTENTRLLGRFCEIRRQLVDERTRYVQQLTDRLKCCFPQALTWPGAKSFSPLMLELLRRWPDPRKLKKADRRILAKVFAEYKLKNQKQQDELLHYIRSMTLLCSDAAVLEPAAIVIRLHVLQIRQLDKSIGEVAQRIDEEMQKHPDADLFRSLPGAGRVMAPRLLTAFGSQRERFAKADDMTTFSGIAPVTKQSGKMRVVHRRYACPKYLRQTFHEFADHARKWCPWSRAYYNLQRSRNMKHHAALRKLASRWIRILFVVWKTRTPYDQAKYLATIQLKNPKIIPFLKT